MYPHYVVAAPDSGTSYPLNIGGPCPPGGYCPRGSAAPTACPLGFFANVTGASNASVCIPCVPGYYCEGSSLPYPTGPCSPGYFCNGMPVTFAVIPSFSARVYLASHIPAGSATTPTQWVTPPGYYSLSASPSAFACQPGTFQFDYSSSSCYACVSGYYCPVSGIIVPTVCSPGYVRACSLTTLRCHANCSFDFLRHYCPTGTSNPLPW